MPISKLGSGHKISALNLTTDIMRATAVSRTIVLTGSKKSIPTTMVPLREITSKPLKISKTDN
jgi:hypothetical protein